MEFKFSEHEIMLQTAANEFSEKKIMPRAKDIDNMEYPADLVKEICGLGYPGLPLPAEYGGSGAGYLSFMITLEQICRASASLGAIMSVNLTPAEAILKYGTEEQKKRFITPLAGGDATGCIGFTEAETGSDPRMITSTCRKNGSRYILNGEKTFICNAVGADYVLIFTKGEKEGINAFIADTSKPGFDVQSPPLDTLGLRGAGTSAVFLDDFEVPEENLLGEEGKGFDILLEAISTERLCVSMQALGTAQASLETAVDYARQRIALGKPISKLPTIQWHLAEMAARLEAARWLAYRTAAKLDEGGNVRAETAMAKLHCSQMAVEVTRMGMQVTGAYGAVRSMPMERYYRDAKMTEIYVGISEVQRVIVANNLIYSK
jgi:alkylation response protein AidB-like acyl-CoA dehydrogenase